MKKTIIIFSDEEDLSTNDVLDWLYFFKGNNKKIKIIRLNDFEIWNLDNKNKNLFQGNFSFWYRRGYPKGNFYTIELKDKLLKDKLKIIFDRYQFEEKAIVKGFEVFLTKNAKSYLNIKSENNINKIEVLYNALEVGLVVPKFSIIDNYKDLETFYFKNNKRIIIKDIMLDNINFIWNCKYKININLKPKIIKYTDILKLKNINNDNKGFIFIQEYIEKKIEIRIFYINKKLYSMAIFSQNNPKTQIDFRNYDYDKPNRLNPFKIPIEISNKIIKLMKKLKIICGSIDMIYTPKGEYVFLEVNPIGQFQWLSQNCNYYIEREIANHLIGKI